MPIDWKIIIPSFMQQEEREMSAPEFWLKLTPANVKKWYAQAEWQLISIKRGKRVATES